MSTGRGLRTALAWSIAVAGLLAIAILGGRSGDDRPYDPRSAEPTGTKALVLLLEELGAQVDLADRPASGADLLVVARDESSLSDDQLDQIDEFVRNGGSVVVTDPFSPLTPEVSAPIGQAGPFATSDSELDPRRCNLEALADAGTIEVAGSYLFDAADASASCYGDATEAFVVVEEGDGGGNIIAVGGTRPFTNEYLGRSDNAVVAANLMAPEPGQTVTFLEDAPADSVADSPFDLVDSSVAQAFVQLAIAFVIYAMWRARRLGQPLVESQPVDVAGSELVVAVGDLLQRTRQPARAAALLRDDVRRSLCDRLGLPAESSVEVVAGAVEARTAVNGARVRDALETASVTDDDDLLSLAREIDALYQEVLHGRAP